MQGCFYALVYKDELVKYDEERTPVNGWPDTVDYTTSIYFGQTNIRLETCDTAN